MFREAVGRLWGEGKKIVDDTEQIDDRFYAEVMDELSQGFKDKAAVGKAIAQSDGNEAKFDSIYMKLRAKSLQNIYFEEKKIKQELQQLEDRKQKISKDSIDSKLKEGYFAKLFKDEISSQGYTVPFFTNGYNEFKKNGKTYYGKIDYKKIRYVLTNENNEYEDSFAFVLK